MPPFPNTADARPADASPISDGGGQQDGILPADAPTVDALDAMDAMDAAKGDAPDAADASPIDGLLPD
jgi:hypothetical protein